MKLTIAQCLEVKKKTGVCLHFFNEGSKAVLWLHSAGNVKVHVHFGNGFGKVRCCCTKYLLFTEYFS